jgi:hypothetical protein
MATARPMPESPPVRIAYLPAKTPLTARLVELAKFTTVASTLFRARLTAGTLSRVVMPVDRENPRDRSVIR